MRMPKVSFERLIYTWSSSDFTQLRRNSLLFLLILTKKLSNDDQLSVEIIRDFVHTPPRELSYNVLNKSAAGKKRKNSRFGLIFTNTSITPGSVYELYWLFGNFSRYYSYRLKNKK